MKQKRFSACLCAAILLFPCALTLGGCATKKTVTLRVFNWEEYIDEGGEGSFIYDELHETDENGKVIEIESDIVTRDYMTRYEEDIGISFNKEGNHIIDDFETWYEKQYGVSVRVEYSTFGTNEDLYNQLKLGDKYDLVCPSEYMIMKLAAEDMIEPIGESFFDEENELNYYVNNVSPFIREKFDNGLMKIGGETHSWSEYAAGYMWGTTGLVYNPETVSEEDLERDGWSILCNRDYYKKVTTKDNVRDSYFVGLAILYRDELLALDPTTPDYNAKVTEIMNRTDEESVAKVQNILLDMKKNIFGFETDTGKSDMVKGTISMNFAWGGDAVYAMDEAEKQDVSLNYFIPKESANLYFDGWAIPKDENRSEETRQAAYAFINFMAKPENAVRNMYYIGYSSVIGGDEVFEYVEYMYGAEEDEEDTVEYDVSYFFGEGAALLTYEDQLKRQLYAQFPPEEETLRCAVMDYYGENEIRINELWTKVKGETLDAWAIIVICVSVAAIALAVVFVKFGNKIDLKRKPKKGYTLIKQEELK